MNRTEIGWTYPIGVYMLHCSTGDWVRECAAGCVTCEPARTEDLCQWSSVIRLICYVDKVLACKELPNNSFFVPLLYGFNNSNVFSAVPYSCLWFSMCDAHDEIELLVLMYRVCSLCLVATDRPDCPTYELLQVLHLSLYIPLEFVLVLTILLVSCWRIVFVARTAMFKLVCLKGLVIFRISGIWQENVTHFLCCCGWGVGFVFVFWLSVSCSGCEWYTMEIHYFGLLQV